MSNITVARRASLWVRVLIGGVCLAVLCSWGGSDNAAAPPVAPGDVASTATPAITKLINSSLVGLSANERYELLKTWMLLVAGRQSVRSLVTIVPDKPVDPALTPGSVRLCFTTLLVDAAKEAGKLDELGALIKPLAEKNVENAKPLWQLIQIARGDGAKGLAELRKYVDERQAAIAASGNNRNIRPLPEDFAIARQALSQPELRGIGRELARSWLSHAQRVFDHAGIVHIRRAMSLSDMALIPNHQYQPTADPGLTHWVASSLRGQSFLNPAGAPSPWWIAHEDMLVHLGGAGHDSLHLAYPLTGTFEISADCYAASWGEANLAYDGLLLETLHGGFPTLISAAGNHDRIGTHDPVERFDEFNRVRIKAEPGQLQLIVNGHLVYRDHDIGPTSPWFGLYPFIFQTAFKNVRIHGEPIIPREVKLTDGDRLEGWVSYFYDETQPPRRTIGRTDWVNRRFNVNEPTTQRDQNLDNYDWAAEAGVIHGRRLNAPAADTTALPSRLFYHRPLRGQETVQYEFFFDPAAGQQVHPTLGRLAFLLEPSGVRLYRFGATSGTATAGTETEITDTDAASFLDAAAHRRGPKQLPLKPQEWNAVELSLTDGIAKLSLNGTLICERPFAATHDLHFGFFHDKLRTAARIRDVVLTGDWPTSLTPELRANLFARNDVPNVTTRHAMAAAIGEQFQSKNSRDILAQARSRSPEERFELLANWVLPSDDHLSWRLYGELAAPLDIKVAAPALELAAVAVQLKKLEELSARLQAAAQRVTEVRGLTPHDHRAISALQLLIAVAKDDRPAATEWLTYLLSLDGQIPKGELEHERWPELFAVYVAMREPDLIEAAELLATKIADRQATDPAGFVWDNRVRHARDWCRSLIANRADQPSGDSKPAMMPFAVVSGVESSRHWPLKQWTPRPVLINSEEAFVGTPRWEFVDGEVAHRAGMGNDLLFFQSPLRGTFRVEADLAAFGFREIELFYSTLWARPRADLVAYESGGAVDQRTPGKIEPKLDSPGDWYRVRLEATGDKWTLFANDRKIHEQPLAPGHDPWLTIHSAGRFSGGARNVRITGTPEIPDEISLSSGDTLANCGWIDQFFKNPADYLYEANGRSQLRPVWEKLGDEIHGPKLSDNFAGSFTETLLEYHRPLSEDGEITYEFYFEPDQALVHPAIGRSAFLLHEDGIAEHFLTHGAHERRQSVTGDDFLSPDNSTVEKTFRRGPKTLPLKARDWNRMRLVIKGKTLTLTLNEVVVYERPLDSIGLRTLGLFRFADQSEARVRNVSYRGDWPKSLPELKQQELAYDSIGESFAAAQWGYTATWNFRDPPPKAFVPSHDFKRFEANAEQTATGMKFKLPAGRDFPSSLIGFMHKGNLRGDFEIIGRFKIHKLDRSEIVDQWKTPGFDLGAKLGETENYITTSLRFKPEQFHGRQVTTMRTWTHSPSKQPRLDARDTPWTAMFGRQRIIRKGSAAYYLMANGNSDEWRILDKKHVDRDDISTVIFFVRNFDPKSHVEIELQELTIKAAQQIE